jgi:hypothetical protein
MFEAAGMKVNWNGELGQAEVTSPELESGGEVMDEQITQTPDGITQIDAWEGKQYIGFIYIRNKAREKGYDFIQFHSAWRIVKGENIILDNIPTTLVYGADSVEANYYINTILPLIK